jgi:hypothetical protein
MHRTSRRATLIAGLLSLVVVDAAFATVTWQAPLLVPGSSAWSGPGALARSVGTMAGTPFAYHQAVYTTDFIGGQPATDEGPFQGVYHRRLRDPQGANTWSSAFRFNPTDEHADRATAAATGRYVFAAWVSIGSVEHFNPAAPRILWLRWNDDHGDAADWEPRQSWSPDVCGAISGCVGARPDRPSLAADGTRLFIAVTEGNTGDVRVWLATRPYDGGYYMVVGTTTNKDAEGFRGLPSVGVAGTIVAAAWLADSAGTIKARVSMNNGIDWGPVTTVATGAKSAPSVDVRGSRIAVGWAAANGAKIRMRLGGTWQPTRTVSAFSPTGTYKAGNAVAIDLAGSATVGVAFTGCRRTDCATTATSTNGIDLLWRESTNNGSTWKVLQTLSNSTTATSRRRSSAPSVVWSDLQHRAVLYSNSSHDRSYERVLLRRGAGAP